MELKFTGRGAMLNPNEGNTSAYFEDTENFFLIDCGEDVAAKLIKSGKLDQDKNYYLFITHTHSDHIGSIGTLQQYLYWNKGKRLKIVVGKDMDYIKNILSIMNSLGLEPTTYDIINITSLDNRSPLFNSIRYKKSNHGDVFLESASIIINTDEGNILYSGDIADTKVIREFISKNPSSIDKMYIDTSLNKSPVHLSLKELRDAVPIGLSGKVYCMHLDQKDLINEARKWGFNVVELDESTLLNRDIDSLSPEELKKLEKLLKEKLNQVESKLDTQDKPKTYLKK